MIEMDQKTHDEIGKRTAEMGRPEFPGHRVSTRVPHPLACLFNSWRAFISRIDAEHYEQASTLYDRS
jgi:hypothetical protein